MRDLLRIGILPRVDFDEAQRDDAEPVVVVLPRVVKHDHVAMARRNGRDLGLNRTRERIEPLIVRRSVGFKRARVRGIHLRERVADLLHVDLGVLGVHPQMRIHVLDVEPGAFDHDFEIGRRDVLERGRKPAFEAGTVFDQQARLREHHRILRRRFVRFGRHADRHEVAHVHVGAADAGDQRVERGDRGDDGNRPRGLHGVAATRGQPSQQRTGEKAL